MANGETWAELTRSEKPLDWRRLVKELSWTPEQILSGERTMIPRWELVKKLLEENG